MRDRPTYAIIGDITDSRRTRGKRNVNYCEMCGIINMACYTSTNKPKNIKEEIANEYWIEAMKDELQHLNETMYGNLFPSQMV